MFLSPHFGDLFLRRLLHISLRVPIFAKLEKTMKLEKILRKSVILYPVWVQVEEGGMATKQ